MTAWQERRYYPISQYFKSRFGEKVGKISVSVAETCPNRQSPKMAACIFCDEYGSAAYPFERENDLAEQISSNRKHVQRRLRANKFLVYFQAYTNTLGRISALEERFKIALAEPDIVGLVVGTRPDCLPERIFPLFRDTAKNSYLMVELGVQSFFDDQLAFLRRGHHAESSLKAIQRLHEQTTADIGIHLIFGLPNESDERLIATARQINQLPIDNVKLHNLHVLKNTPLATLYQNGEFATIELDEYARRVIIFLRHLSPQVAVQRLAAVANRGDELIAPQWTREKMQPLIFIEEQMAQAGYFQGDLYDGQATQA